MKMPEYQRLEITCDCHDPMHRVFMEYDDLEPDMGIQFCVMMNQERPWWKRIIPAIRYFLNLRGANDWHYTDVMAQHNITEEARRFLDQFHADWTAYHDHREGKAESYTPLRGFTRPGHKD